MAGVNVSALIGVLLFYLLILLIGVLASWIKKRRMTTHISEDQCIVTGDKQMGYLVGIFTMTATWVGGGYISGTVEMVFGKGFAWCQAPFGYSLGLVIGGLFFAKYYRSREFTTMIDPFQLKYGRLLGGSAYLPALFGELVWSAFILRTLGTSMSVVLGLDVWSSCIISASIAIAYTLFGGLFSVAYTDVFQLSCIMFGLVLCVPFAWYHPASTIFHDNPISFTNATLLGTVEPREIGIYIDVYLVFILGGFPWQIYFQRVLAARTPEVAQVLSFAGAAGCVIMSIPCMVAGAVAKYTNWTYFEAEGLDSLILESNDFAMPLLINYLTPKAVSFFGLGAVAAAVMSSSDSSLLASSSMLAHNIYKGFLRPRATEKEVLWVWRCSVIIFGATATIMGIKTNDVYKMFYLCSDLVYVVLFPQIVLFVYWAPTNQFGYIVGCLLSLALRLLAGEDAFAIPPIIHYPWFDGKDHFFPFRTFAMLCNFAATMLVSVLTNKFLPSHIPRNANLKTLRKDSNKGISHSKEEKDGIVLKALNNDVEHNHKHDTKESLINGAK